MRRLTIGRSRHAVVRQAVPGRKLQPFDVGREEGDGLRGLGQTNVVAGNEQKVEAACRQLGKDPRVVNPEGCPRPEFGRET